MPEPPRTCPVCAAAVPAAFPAGLCPECLMKATVAMPPDFRPSDNPKPEGTPVASLAVGAANPRPGPRAPEVESLQPLFPDLEIVELLGVGGMGAVYKARQPRLNRFVALKLLSCPPEHRGDFALRFEREAQVLARLSHPHIVAIHDFGEIDADRTGGEALFYFLMEYVDGQDLARLLRSRRLTQAEALDIAGQVCEALQYAHEEGITHRDIKPANILVNTKGRIKIADFGLAKLVQGEETPAMPLTMTGTVMGTPHYMAPEQWECPEAVDHRVDIFSLGVVLYELLTGQRPAGVFDPPSKLGPVDKRIDSVVMRAMEKEPDRRYQQASEVRADVTRISTVKRRAKESDVDRAGGKKSRLPLTLGVGVVLGLGGWWFWQNQMEKGRAVDTPAATVAPVGTDAPVATAPTPPVSESSPAFPSGQWVTVLATQADLEAHPDFRGKRGIRFADGWVDVTAAELTPSFRIPGLTGRNQGLRLRGRTTTNLSKPASFNILLRTGSGSADDRFAYQLSLGGLDTVPYLVIRHYSFSTRTGDLLAHVNLEKSPKPGDEFLLEFYVIGDRLVGRINGTDLPMTNDKRLDAGEVYFQASHLIRDVEAINLDGLSEAEALKLVGVEGTRTATLPVPASPPVSLSPMSGSLRPLAIDRRTVPDRHSGAIESDRTDYPVVSKKAAEARSEGTDDGANGQPEVAPKRPVACPSGIPAGMLDPFSGSPVVSLVPRSTTG